MSSPDCRSDSTLFAKGLRSIATLWRRFEISLAMAKLNRAERRIDQAADDLQDARVALNRLVEAPAPLLDRERQK